MSDATGGIPNARPVSFGQNVVNDTELRVIGDVRGKRTLEVGLFGTIPNCVALAQRGAKSIAVDPSAENIARARTATANSEVSVEFHQSEIADLGFLMSATIDLALCVHQITMDTDIARLFRQVHRVLKPEAGFVFVLGHPAAAIFDGNDPFVRRAYGSNSPTIGELAMTLQRANFSIDIMHELTPENDFRAIVPSTLVVRARKLGS
jgi:SAM-dependent methyltransferase